MRSSKVVKGPLRASMNIKEYALKDMVAEEEAAVAAKAKAEEELRAKDAAEKEEARQLAEKKARQKAYEEGVAVGFEDGHGKGVSEGYAKGFQEGEESGKVIKAEALVDYDKVISLLLPLVSGLERLVEKIEASAEKDVLAIAIAVARRVVRKEISADSEVVLGFVTEGLKGLGPVETAFIRIHPSDFELLSKRNVELLEAVEGVKSLKFEPDQTLLPGDCIVESKERSVDMRSDNQISSIEKRLLSEPKQEMRL